MKKISIAVALGILLGALAAQAKLPPAPPKSEAEKKAAAQKDDAQKAKDATDLAKAQDKAVANYKKHAKK